MDKIEHIIEFLTQHIEILEWSSGAGLDFDFPKFDLMPFDYLEFANSNFEESNDEKLINCVGHLKKAIHCQVDTFFHVLGIGKLLEKKNLKFDQKLEAIETMGVFQSRSLKLLNRIRNKVEHSYIVPKIGDLQVYYELCDAFVSLLEATMMMIANHSEMEWIEENGNRGVKSAFVIRLDTKKTNLLFKLFDGTKDEEINIQPKDKETTIEFLKGLGILVLLYRFMNMVNSEFVKNKLLSLKGA